MANTSESARTGGARAPMRIGIIGAGNISVQYLTTLSRYEDVEVAGIAATSPERAQTQADAFRVPACTASDLLSDASIELIVNITPPAAHRDITLTAIAAGKHVWSEKPLALSVHHARELSAAAHAAGVRIGAAPDTILGPAHVRALAAIRDGSIGRPRSARAIVQYWGPDAWHPRPEFLFAAGAGPLNDMGAYWLTLMLRVFGPARSVVANARTSRHQRVVAKGPRAGTVFQVDVPTYVAALIDFADGATAECVFSFESASKQFTLSVTGDEGEIIFANPNEFEGDVARIERDDKTEIARDEQSIGDGRGIGVIDLVRSIRSGQPPLLDPALAVDVVALTAAMDEAGRTGERVFLDPQLGRHEDGG